MPKGEKLEGFIQNAYVEKAQFNSNGVLIPILYETPLEQFCDVPATLYIGENPVEKLEARIRELEEGLLLIGTSCQSYNDPFPGACYRNGRRDGAKYAAEATCTGCIAHRLLTPSK